MGRPVFVTEIRPDTNEVVIGDNADVFAQSLVCSHINAMSVPEFTEGLEVIAKIRYNHKGAPAVLSPTGKEQADCPVQGAAESDHPWTGGCVL